MGTMAAHQAVWPFLMAVLHAQFHPASFRRMLRHPLDGSYAKVERARENLRALNEATKAFLEPSPYALAVDDNPETGENTVVHDLRSALDHAVWQLVIADHGTPGRHNQFPIYTDEGNFLRDVVDRPSNRGPGPLDGIERDGPAWTFIQGEQPYQRRHPEYTVLRHLRILSNLDKHQTLVPALSFLQAVDVQALESIIESPIESRTDLARLRFDPNGPEPQVYVDPGLTLDIAFGEAGEQLRWGDLQNIRVGVAALIGQLEEFF
jgi:hypothetical protein